jgi:hypothetical protein
MAGLARFAEGVLLQAGRRVEAYEKYALAASRATTYLATFTVWLPKQVSGDRCGPAADGPHRDHARRGGQVVRHGEDAQAL